MNETFFPTIFELRSAHAALLAQQRKGTPFDPFSPEVKSFVVRARDRSVARRRRAAHGRAGAERTIAAVDELALRTASRPIRLGSSVGAHVATSACCLVYGKQGERYLFSMHLAAEPGAQVHQPAPVDGNPQAIGTIARSGKDPSRSGTLILLDPGVNVDMKFPKAKVIRRLAKTVRRGDEVRAAGRGSGLSIGRVLAVRDKDIITTIDSQPGDSGAPVVNNRNELVGVIFSGSNAISAVLPMQPLLEELEVTLEPPE